MTAATVTWPPIQMHAATTCSQRTSVGPETLSTDSTKSGAEYSISWPLVEAAPARPRSRPVDQTVTPSTMSVMAAS